MSLEATAVGYAVAGRSLLQAASLRLQPGEVHALLGPNGAGKSTLLQLLAGDLAPQTGTVALNGRALSAWTPRNRARQRAVLPQRDNLRFGFRTEDVVALGRLPVPRQAPAREAAIVTAALEAADVLSLRERSYVTLSGGERARVQLARVLAQIWETVDLGPRYLLLDEPTASLDLAHQHACLRRVRGVAADGVGVLAILHDPNLALRYADRVTLLREGRVLATGDTRTTLSAETLSTLYGLPLRLETLSGGAHALIVPDTA